MQLVLQRPHHAVHHAATAHGRALGNFVGPANHVGVLRHLQKLPGFVQLPLGHAAVPRPNGNVGNGVGVARHKLAVGQALVQHIHLALHLHGKTVNRVFHLERRVGIKVPKTTAQVRRAAHLPEQPRHAFGTQGGVGGHQGSKLLGQVQQNGARLKHPHRLGAAVVYQRRNFGIGVGPHKAAAELVALMNAHQPCVVFGPSVAQRQQLFKHHRHLHAIGRAQRIKLQRMLAAL